MKNDQKSVGWFVDVPFPKIYKVDIRFRYERKEDKINSLTILFSSMACRLVYTHHTILFIFSNK